MRYVVWSPGIGNDSGFNSYHNVLEEAFGSAVAYASALQNFWAQTGYSMVIDSQSEQWGVYDSSNQQWTGDLRP
jgi:hypothetical protein